MWCTGAGRGLGAGTAPQGARGGSYRWQARAYHTGRAGTTEVQQRRPGENDLPCIQTHASCCPSCGVPVKHAGPRALSPDSCPCLYLSSALPATPCPADRDRGANDHVSRSQRWSKRAQWQQQQQQQSARPPAPTHHAGVHGTTQLLPRVRACFPPPQVLSFNWLRLP